MLELQASGPMQEHALDLSEMQDLHRPHKPLLHEKRHLQEITLQPDHPQTIPQLRTGGHDLSLWEEHQLWAL